MAALQIHLLLAAVSAAAYAVELDMKFLKEPESVTAPVGDRVTFECEVNVPAEWLAWRMRTDDGRALGRAKWTAVAKSSALDINSNSTYASLVAHVREDTRAAMYQCLVSFSSIILVSVPARLSIARLDASSNAAERRVVTAPMRNYLALHCREPASDPPAMISWWKETYQGLKTQLDTPHGVLVIHNATGDDSGTYGCKATNDLSQQTEDLPEKVILQVQNEGRSDVRFLETEEYIGNKDSEGVLTVPVKMNGVLRLWCGMVGSPPPKVTWTRDGKFAMKPKHDHMLVISQFSPDDEGVYSCSANGLRRSWKVIALQAPSWGGNMRNLTAFEDGNVNLSCGTAHGQPPPEIYWVMNGQLLKNGKEGVRVTNTDLFIDHLEKRHAGIIQCFACNSLGCAYDASLLTVIPLQISDPDYPGEDARIKESQPPKKHNKKNNSRKHKPIMIPPSRPNVTRLTDDSVMVSWSKAPNHGLPIQFYKVQYKEVSNSSNVQWNTATHEVPTHIHSLAIDGLSPDKYYKFRVAAVYSNQDNKQGKSSSKFYLQRGGALQKPQPPTLEKIVAISPYSLQLEWTWSSGPHNISAGGFYVYYRSVSSAGEYEKVVARAEARSLALDHLMPDTGYEVKMQAYTLQAPSDFSSILVGKTQRSPAGSSTSEAPPSDVSESRRPDALVTAGGAIGAAALLLILVVTLLLCRRAKRVPVDKEKGSAPETGGNNGYIPANAKVPITITANPMHSEGGENGVEMAFLHNNNTGNNDDTLPHSRKNGPARQYV